MMPTASPRLRRGKTLQRPDICVSVRAQLLDAFQTNNKIKCIFQSIVLPDLSPSIGKSKLGHNHTSLIKNVGAACLVTLH